MCVRLADGEADEQIGTLVYARVSVASRDMEPELECVDATTGKAEGFGELKGGLMIHTSLEFARQYVLSPSSTDPGRW